MAKIKFIQFFLMMVAIVIGHQETYAQALSYSQYYNAPLLVNPANTGFNPDYDYRAGLNYRNSWSAIGADTKPWVYGPIQNCLLTVLKTVGWVLVLPLTRMWQELDN